MTPTPASLAIIEQSKLRGESPVFVGSDGDGDSCVTLWRFSDGTEVIETNGDPIWDTDDEFRAMVSDMSGLSGL
jgi:hypothetical protein